ncbi:hypothetical protein EZJ19_00550 [Parasulfuritortus cantonensis]|uniref:Uncharacterized protein n=1 Tax=Parasulfuritortus cantonensis TaxID=2528202 RepID=A0A4R1BRP5_9PROT|nr:hypothetical protein [Parasulfuritortus cantonensis]TCJ20414.1 hypothetical protein EZJ19_00550 [Parasulfuritortus cantonensis]
MAEAITDLVGVDGGGIVRTGPVVVYAPGGRNRKRFPDNCVTTYPDEHSARAAARPDDGYHAAIASGPSRSSEGFYLFYLLRWLD